MSLLALIDFAAAVQGFLLAYFLLRRHGRSLPHRLLAALVFAISIVLLGSVLGISGYYRVWPHLIRIADPFVLLFGPLLYFHVYAATRGRLPRAWIMHLIPFMGYILFVIPFYLLPGAEKIKMVEEVMSAGLSPTLATILIVRTAHMLCYSAISLMLLRRFQRDLREQYSNVAERDLHHAMWFLYGYIGVTLGHLIIVTSGMFLHVDIISANGVYGLMLGGCVYALAYVSWPHPTRKEDPRPAPTPLSSERPRRVVHHLSNEQLKMLSMKMVSTLEKEKAYLDGDLTVAQLSERMAVPAYQVSETINRHYHSNFFDAVNRLRVEEVKRRLTDPEHAVYSIVAIAMDSGFNSKSSFNTAFKKHTGTTPSQFRSN